MYTLLLLRYTCYYYLRPILSEKERKNEPGSPCQRRKCKNAGQILNGPSAEYKYFGEHLQQTSHSSNSRRPTRNIQQQHEAFGKLYLKGKNNFGIK
jgi:hypothetical protein